MGFLRRRGSASPITRFGVLSLLVTIAVGAGLPTVLSTLIEERARQQAEDAALMAVRLGLQPTFSRADLATGFDADRPADVEMALDESSAEFRSADHGLAALRRLPVDELKIDGPSCWARRPRRSTPSWCAPRSTSPGRRWPRRSPSSWPCGHVYAEHEQASAGS